MQKLLTDAYCKAAKATGGKRLDVVDLRCVGLNFRITEAGAKSWAFRFRDPVTRRLARFTIGRYPDIPLSDARTKGNVLREQVAAGINPADAQEQEREDAPQRKFKVLADRYMKEHARRHKRASSADGDELNLKTHVLPIWKDKDYRKIRRGDVIELIEGIVTDGKHTAANRVHSLISKIFSFAIDADLLEANPAARLRKRGVEKTGKRVLSDAELRQFWRDVVRPPVSRRTGIALRLALLTGCRANEITGMRRSELDQTQDSKRRAWTVPGERTKNKRPHLVPLTALAWDMIATVLDSIDDTEDCLFPSPRNKGTPIGRHALAVATSRFCDVKTEDEDAPKWLGEPFSPHDLRRTFSTRLSALGVLQEDRAACLNHTRSDIEGKHYDLYERAKEKRTALNKLSAAVLRITEGAFASSDEQQ